jgi:hypothetical protein
LNVNAAPRFELELDNGQEPIGEHHGAFADATDIGRGVAFAWMALSSERC